MSVPSAPAEPPAAPRAKTVIEPRSRWRLAGLLELWRYRELLVILARRDVTVRYRQAVVGVAWALLQPAATLLVFGVLFRQLGRFPTRGDEPYALAAFCGLLPWQFFATSLHGAAASLFVNRAVVTKVYFPRMLLPAASVLVGLVDFAVSLSLLAGLCAWYGYVPPATAVLLPGFVAVAGLAAFGAGLWLSALTALYRDFAHVTPFLVQVLFFASPVVYETASLVPARWRPLYGLNPMAGAIEGFRWSFLGGRPPDPALLAASAASVVALVVGGAAYFRRTEDVLTDRI